MEEKKLEWKLSNRLIEYFASSIYGQNFDIIAVRELLQNAIDAKAKTFTLRIDTDKDVQIINDGEVLDLKTIETALFTLGESTKEQGDKTGFFGVGEVAVIAPCESWKIESGMYVIDNFVLKENNKYVNGTVHTLKLRNSVNAYGITRFLAYHNLPLKINVFSYGATEQINRKQYKKCRKFNIPHGVFTWVKSGDSKTVLRINGLPQHIINRFDQCGTWIIDLDTSTVLTVNREAIRNDEINTAINVIEQNIQRIADHTSGDTEDKFLTISQNPLTIRQKGYVIRRDITAKPIRKIYNCVKIVNDFFQIKLEKTVPIGLMFADHDTLAMVHNGTIFINVDTCNLHPITQFTLKLLDKYTHELAHLTCSYQSHALEHQRLRYIVYDNSELISKIRNEVRNT